MHPALTRVREDKSVNEVDVRLSQLTERGQVPDLEVKAEKMVLPESAIIRREVYTKVTKGKAGVRKLLRGRPTSAADEQGRKGERRRWCRPGALLLLTGVFTNIGYETSGLRIRKREVTSSDKSAISMRW